jgi:hypothetical protein
LREHASPHEENLADGYATGGRTPEWTSDGQAPFFTQDGSMDALVTIRQLAGFVCKRLVICLKLPSIDDVFEFCFDFANCNVDS